MGTQTLDRRDFLGWLALSVVASRTGLAHAQKEDPLCVIVGVSSAQQGLSLGEVRRIFLHQPTDDVRGNRFIPLNLPSKSPARVRFDQTVLGFGPDEMARYWVDQRIRGTQAPRVIPTTELLLRVLSRLPGSVSYAPASQLTAEVRALRIDGKKHTDASYPLSARR